MLPEIGKLLLYIALSLSAILPILAVSHKSNYYKTITLGVLTATSLAFLILVYSFAMSDFSVLLVANNSHTSKPIIYKISAAWGNHEGSMLMWIVCVSFFNFLYAILAKHNRHTAITVSVQSIVNFMFIAFVIFLSNPFTRIFPAPMNGLGFNPILQDIGLAMHPPTLYLGYVGFSICYSSALAALITRIDPREWALSVKPYLMLSWSFLTAGIGLGSWWAYRELGWGGYWFWDPVENASLIPWLCGAALIHSLMMVIKDKGMMHWSLILSIMTFSLCVVGTFLVRSGLITSVHSFATDPSRGVAILSIIFILSTLGFVVYGLNAASLKTKTSEQGFFCATSFISLNNLLLIFFASVVVVGTVYPMMLELFTSEKISVGAPYYNAIVAPTALFMVILCSLYPLIINKKHTHIWVPQVFGAVLLTSIIIYLVPSLSNWFYYIIIFCSAYLLIDSARMFKNITMSLCHMGFALLVLAVSINSISHAELEKTIQVGEKVQFGKHSIELKAIEYFKGSNYFSRQAAFEVYDGKKLLSILHPEVRLYPIEQQQTAESDIYHSIFYDLYITIGQTNKNEDIGARIYYRPAISFIWLSCLLIFSGSLISIIKKLKVFTRNGRHITGTKNSNK